MSISPTADAVQDLVHGTGGLPRERLEGVGQVIPLPAEPVVLLPESPHLLGERGPLGLERSHVGLEASRIIQPSAQNLHELVRLVRPSGHLVGHPHAGTRRGPAVGRLLGHHRRGRVDPHRPAAPREVPPDAGRREVEHGEDSRIG